MTYLYKKLKLSLWENCRSNVHLLQYGLIIVIKIIIKKKLIQIYCTKKIVIQKTIVIIEISILAHFTYF